MSARQSLVNLSTGESPTPAVTRLSELSASRGDAETGGAFAGGAPAVFQRPRAAVGKLSNAERFRRLGREGLARQ